MQQQTLRLKLPVDHLVLNMVIGFLEQMVLLLLFKVFPRCQMDHWETTTLPRFDASGRLLLGTTTEGEANADDLTVATSSHTGITIRSGTSHRSNIYFSDGTSGDAEYRGYIQYNHDGDKLTLGVNNAGAVNFDSSGRVLIGGAIHKTNMDRNLICKYRAQDLMIQQ